MDITREMIQRHRDMLASVLANVHPLVEHPGHADQTVHGKAAGARAIAKGGKAAARRVLSRAQGKSALLRKQISAAPSGAKAMKLMKSKERLDAVIKGLSGMKLGKAPGPLSSKRGRRR
jgi:hypothetical protein